MASRRTARPAAAGSGPSPRPGAAVRASAALGALGVPDAVRPRRPPAPAPRRRRVLTPDGDGALPPHALRCPHIWATYRTSDDTGRHAAPIPTPAARRGDRPTF